MIEKDRQLEKVAMMKDLWGFPETNACLKATPDAVTFCDEAFSIRRERSEKKSRLLYVPIVSLSGRTKHPCE